MVRLEFQIAATSAIQNNILTLTRVKLYFEEISTNKGLREDMEDVGRHVYEIADLRTYKDITLVTATAKTVNISPIITNHKVSSLVFYNALASSTAVLKVQEDVTAASFDLDDVKVDEYTNK